MHYSIAYISRADDDLTDEEISDLLYYSETKNSSADITGLLLFKDGNFLQVLEGTKDQVISLYEKIGRDKRHDNVQIIFHEQVDQVIFTSYNTKFNLITNSFELASLKGFLRNHKRYASETEVSKKLDSFLELNWFS